MSDKIINRVRKLFALANDKAATEGERDNALRMAYATIAKFNLSMTDIGDGTAQEETRQEVNVSLEVYPWARTISHAIAKLFFCAYYFERPAKGKKGRHAFIGRASNAVTASELSAYIVASVLRESVRLYGSYSCHEAGSFDKGVAAKVWSRCEELRKAAEQDNKAEASTGRALVLVDLYASEVKANQLWLANSGVKLRTAADRQSNDIARNAYNAGKDYGAKVSLNASIGGSKANALRIK